MPGKIYKDSVGIGIELDTKLTADLLEATTARWIEVIRPDGTGPVLWGATVVADTGRILYYIMPGDLNLVGTYLLQAVLQYDTSITRGNTVRMKVYDLFE